MTSTTPFLFLPIIFSLLNFSAVVQFTTHLSDSLDDPVFKKGAAFVFQFQDVTPESESKVRVFSPFPRIPDINLTNAHTILQKRGHSDTLAGMTSVKMCDTADMEHLYDNLFNRLEEKLRILENEIQAAQTDQHNLVTMASSFLPPSMHPHEAPSRSKRAIGLIAAAAGAAGLALGDPVKEAACSALSIFNLCTDTTDLQNDIDGILATRNQFQDVLQRVQTKNDEKFVLLDNEIKDTQDSVVKITKLVGTQLKALETELMEIKGVIATFRFVIDKLYTVCLSCNKFEIILPIWEHCTHILNLIKPLFTPTRLRSTPRFRHWPLGMSALNSSSLPNWPPLSMSLPMTRFSMAPNSRLPSMWARKPFTMNSRWF